MSNWKYLVIPVPDRSLWVNVWLTFLHTHRRVKTLTGEGMQRGISWQWRWALGKRRWPLWAEWLSLPRSLFLSKQAMKGRLAPTARSLPHSWHFSAHTQTYWHVPGVGWCFQWGKGDLSDLWSRASTLQQQSPGHISAQPGDPLLQGKPTAHCPTLLKLHSVWGGGVLYIDIHLKSYQHIHKHPYLFQTHLSGCWSPSENLVL